MNKSLKYFVCIIAIVMLMFPVLAFAADDYPSPTKGFFVNDFADVLQDETEYSILDLGKQLENKTGAQVVVVTIDSLQGKSIEEYALELGRKWGIGQKDENNGVLLLNAVQEREIDIEVGYGLEGAIPDIRAREIIREYIKPYLKNGDYDRGLLQGYIAIADDIAQEYSIALDMGSADNPMKQNQNNLPDERKSQSLNLAPIIIIALLIVDGVLFRFRITSTIMKIVFWSNFFRGGRGGGGGWGGSGGGGSWGGGSSGGGGSFGGGGSSDKY